MPGRRNDDQSINRALTVSYMDTDTTWSVAHIHIMNSLIILLRTTRIPYKACQVTPILLAWPIFSLLKTLHRRDVFWLHVANHTIQFCPFSVLPSRPLLKQMTSPLLSVWVERGTRLEAAIRVGEQTCNSISDGLNSGGGEIAHPAFCHDSPKEETEFTEQFAQGCR